jgi:hypothetical protein
MELKLHLSCVGSLRIPLIVTDQCKKPQQRPPGVPPGHDQTESSVTISGIRIYHYG